MSSEKPATPKPGVYAGMSFPDYVALEAVNFHTLWRLIDECPAKALLEYRHGTKETKAMAFGSLTDFVLLEPARFAKEAVVEPQIGEGFAPRRPTSRQLDAKNPSPATLEAIEFWQTWDAENDGKIVVTQKDYDDIMHIAAAVRAAQCDEYICGGISQVVLVWVDEKTSLLCKARVDYELRAGFAHLITDLKSSVSAKEDYWRYALFKYGYFMQMAFYHDGWACLKNETSQCNWLVVEKEEPWIAKVWECGEPTLQAGRNRYRWALDRWAECLKTQTWPAYGDAEVIDLDEWALRRCGVGPELIPTPVVTETHRVKPEATDFAEAYGLEE